MMNMFNPKRNRVIAGVIAALLIFSMVLGAFISLVG